MAGSRELSPEVAAALRALPSVEELRGEIDAPHAIAVQAARHALADARARIRAGEEPGDVVAVARAWVSEQAEPGLRRVINASGVIVHTNLGRAPLADSAREAVARVAEGYSNLEFELAGGERGSRQAHVAELLCDLTGAEAALVVNNCAGAVLLAAAALAGGRELVVSRGQLVEIGGSFRVPDVVAQSGAVLVEVGTTNRTRLADYEAAVGDGTGALMRAHQSNFRTVGFVEEPSIEELCSLGVPVIDDVGSGALADGVPEVADEPAVKRSVAAGAAVVCFSGDKLLGGPQAGVMVGRANAIAACKSHPLARALRIDKLSLAALEATLRLYRDPKQAQHEIPALRMLTAGESELQARAERMASAIARARTQNKGLSDLGDGGHSGAAVIRASAKAGGGALPLLELEGPVCAVDPGDVGADELARRLRSADPPVVGRTRDGWLLLDPRTLTDDEADTAARAVIEALG